uniref:Uncharacterized protein n=1 Tax=Cajanus cajan TaxID=3821 RepID=A0A151QND8_CAJCA|nr:hypothetical protein KK1_047677 [Cajanus cajan]
MVKEAQMQPSNMIVRAFDGSRREVMGEVVLPIQVGLTIFNVEFQVMDIAPTYICFLGRPWIHQARPVPSTLHQKVKFVVDNKLVVVQIEEDIIISKPLTIPYVEVVQQGLGYEPTTKLKKGEPIILTLYEIFQSTGIRASCGTTLVIRSTRSL